MSTGVTTSPDGENLSRYVLGIDAHFSKSLVLWGFAWTLCVPLSLSKPLAPLPSLLCSPDLPCLSQGPSAFPWASCLSSSPKTMSKSLYFVGLTYSHVIIGRESYFVDTLIELLVTRFALQWLSQPLCEKPELDLMRDSFVVKRRDGSSLPKRTMATDFVQSVSVC